MRHLYLPFAEEHVLFPLLVLKGIYHRLQHMVYFPGDFSEWKLGGSDLEMSLGLGGESRIVPGYQG